MNIVSELPPTRVNELIAEFKDTSVKNGEEMVCAFQIILGLYKMPQDQRAYIVQHFLRVEAQLASMLAIGLDHFPQNKG